MADLNPVDSTNLANWMSIFSFKGCQDLLTCTSFFFFAETHVYINFYRSSNLVLINNIFVFINTKCRP